MSGFKSGDRVRGASDWAVQTITDDPIDLTHVLNNRFELVEVAHYAPPGVPMVAMTPERIKALDFVLRATFYPGSENFLHGDVEREIVAMLAEARNECKWSKARCFHRALVSGYCEGHEQFLETARQDASAEVKA